MPTKRGSGGEFGKGPEMGKPNLNQDKALKMLEAIKSQSGEGDPLMSYLLDKRWGYQKDVSQDEKDAALAALVEKVIYNPAISQERRDKIKEIIPFMQPENYLIGRKTSTGGKGAATRMMFDLRWKEALETARVIINDDYRNLRQSKKIKKAADEINVLSFRERVTEKDLAEEGEMTMLLNKIKEAENGLCNYFAASHYVEWHYSDHGDKGPAAVLLGEDPLDVSKLDEYIKSLSFLMRGDKKGRDAYQHVIGLFNILIKFVELYKNAQRLDWLEKAKLFVDLRLAVVNG